MDNAPVVFSDITKLAGLAQFKHRSGTPAKETILETMGSGVALLDYDNDGWLDIYLMNGSTVAALKGQEPPPRAMLFHNNHDGTFTDVTEKAGVANERWGFGVAVGDYDNDGWPDIYVANYGKNRLYHNNHDGTFTDVAEKAGVASVVGPPDPLGEIMITTDLLDLFVPGYVKFDVDHPPVSGRGKIPPNSCQFRGVPVFCGPRGLPGESTICSTTMATARLPMSASRPESPIRTGTMVWRRSLSTWTTMAGSIWSLPTIRCPTICIATGTTARLRTLVMLPDSR